MTNSEDPDEMFVKTKLILKKDKTISFGNYNVTPQYILWTISAWGRIHLYTKVYNFWYLLKTSEFSGVHSTPENSDVFKSQGDPNDILVKLITDLCPAQISYAYMQSCLNHHKKQGHESGKIKSVKLGDNCIHHIPIYCRKFSFMVMREPSCKM